MTRQEFIAEIEDLVEVDSGSLSEDVALADLERWDSLAVVAFIAIVDENFEFTPQPEMIKKSKTVGDLLNIVGDKFQ